MLPAPAIAAIVTPLILWRVYQRVKRLLVRQKSELWRHRLSLGVMTILLLVFGVQGLGHPVVLAALAAGIAVGAGLGLLALQRTTFEQVGDDFYYVPHAPIGIVVALLFIGRLAYRGYEMLAFGAEGAAHFTSGPMTLGVFGVMIGYYALYNGGLLRWRASNKQ
jgi:hypothetical protein